MTIDEAKAKGYEIKAASMFEVGLIKKGVGMRTWFAGTFGGKMPDLDHPVIQECIQVCEECGL